MVRRLNAPGRPVVLVDLGHAAGLRHPYETMRTQGLPEHIGLTLRKPKPPK